MAYVNTDPKSYVDQKSTTPLSNNGKAVVVHGSNASTARPSGFASVEWIGSVEPTNATNNDTWVDTT